MGNKSSSEEKVNPLDITFKNLQVGHKYKGYRWPMGKSGKKPYLGRCRTLKKKYTTYTTDRDKRVKKKNKLYKLSWNDGDFIDTRITPAGKYTEPTFRPCDTNTRKKKKND